MKKVKYLNHFFSSRSALEKISSGQKSEECPRDDRVHVNIKTVEFKIVSSL